MKALFASGNNLGITLAESPLCRSEFKSIQPKCVEDIAKCLALIRPAARESEGNIIYDDDAIEIIAKEVGCSEAQADAYRRGLAKKDRSIVHDITSTIGSQRLQQLQLKLSSLNQYGFCKAHAMSYAQLVTWLAWCKLETPQSFWKGALNHCHSSYKPWVHLWEAWKEQVNPYDKTLLKNHVSVYAKSKKEKEKHKPILQQLKTTWKWDVRKGFIPNCYYILKPNGVVSFRGVIACYRRISKTSIAFCVGCGLHYVDFVCQKSKLKDYHRIVSGFVREDGTSYHIQFY